MSSRKLTNRELFKIYGEGYNSSWDRNFRDDLFDGSGVYVFYMDGVTRPIYVGSSLCLSGRIKGHEVVRMLRFIGNPITVKWKPIKNKKEMLSLEKRLIKKTKPYINISGADYNKKTDNYFYYV